MEKEIGIYIHIPFCKSKCFYCNFASYCNMDKYIEEYINAVSRHEVSDAVRKEVKKYYEKSTKGGTCISGEYTIDPSFLPKRVNDGMSSFIVPKPGVAIPEEYNRTGSEPSTPGAKALTKTPNGSCPF